MQKQKYPNPHKHLVWFIDQEAKRYAEGVLQMGLQDSPRLKRAMSRRAIAMAERDYLERLAEVHDNNIKAILKEYHREESEIKRRGARLRLWLCLPSALLFGLIAWYNFNHGNTLMGIILYIGSMSFLAMFVCGILFDRPTE